MNYEFFDNSRIQEKIIDKVIYNEIIYKEYKGEGVISPARLGRLDEEMIYPNRKVINTRNDDKLTNVQVKIYFRTFTDEDSTLIIDIFDLDSKSLIKKFIIKSINNDYSISDMKNVIDEINEILNNNDNNGNKILKLIEFIRYNEEKIIFEEVAQ